MTETKSDDKQATAKRKQEDVVNPPTNKKPKSVCADGTSTRDTKIVATIVPVSDEVQPIDVEVKDDHPVEWVQAGDEGKKRKHFSPLHLTMEEFDDLRVQSLDESDPDTNKKIKTTRAYIHIAKTVPAEFVGNRAFRYERSLSPIGFQCFHENFSVLRVVQVLAGGIDAEEYMLAGAVACAMGTSEFDDGWAFMGRSMKAAHAISHLLCVADLPSIKETMDISTGSGLVAKYTPGEWEKEESYEFLKGHWDAVRLMADKRLPKAIPVVESTQWLGYAKRVIVHETAISLVPQRGADGSAGGWIYTLTDTSIWKKAQIDLPEYARWLQSDKSKLFDISQLVHTQCGVCDSASSHMASCVLQGGVWRCMDQQGTHKADHRDLHEPLDTGYPKDFKTTR